MSPGAGFVTPPQNATVAADGTASITFSVPVGGTWIITRMAVSSTSAFPSQARVFVNGIFQLGTGAGNGDSATGNPIIAGQGVEITIEWTGAQPGSSCSGTLTYQFGA